MAQPNWKSRIVALKVAPEKLSAIINKPPPEPLSVFNPHAATPPTPIAQRSEHFAQPAAATEASAASGDSLFQSATFAGAFGPTPSSSSPFASSSTQQTISTRSSFSAAVQELQLPPLPPLSPSNTVMAEKDNQKQPAAGSAAAAPANGEGGVPFYESQRKHLQKLLEKKRKLTESLVSLCPPPPPPTNILSLIYTQPIQWPGAARASDANLCAC